MPPPAVHGSAAVQLPTSVFESALTGRGRLVADDTEAAKVSLSESARVQAWRTEAIALGHRAREADAALEKAIELVKGMKAQLSSITKQFPPFPADSDERLRYLIGFSGLRAQVESLTFPPEPRDDGHWARIQFPPERIGWDIPRLDPASASEAAVEAAESLLEHIIDDLGQRRQTLFDSVVSVVGGASGVDQARHLAERIRGNVAD